MQSKSIILIFSAFMLLQTQALPRMRREAGGVAGRSKWEIAGGGDSEARRPRQVLMTTTLVDIGHLAKYVTEHGQPILEKVLSQLEALPEKSPALQANITRIADFLGNNSGDDVDGTAEKDRMMSLFESTYNFMDIMKDLHDMPADLEETQLLQKAFTDNGSEKFEEDLLAELKVVTGKFEKAVETYLNILSEKAKQRETKLIDFYTKLANEKDEEKKAEHYTSFFDTYNP